jgi:AbrB family looped-hinge helix DNA binding protein
MNTQNIKVDSKGRIIIPNSFRDVLGIKFGENIVAQVDKENSRLILFPIQKKTKKMSIILGDIPGSLSKTAVVLARNGVDLVYTESRSSKRNKEAEWFIVADFSKVDLNKLKSDLKKEKAVKKFKIEALER